MNNMANLFSKKYVFSDEAHYHLNGYVNKQNCWIWGLENPWPIHKQLMHPQKVCLVWILGQGCDWAILFWKCSRWCSNSQWLTLLGDDNIIFGTNWTILMSKTRGSNYSCCTLNFSTASSLILAIKTGHQYHVTSHRSIISFGVIWSKRCMPMTPTRFQS